MKSNQSCSGLAIFLNLVQQHLGIFALECMSDSPPSTITSTGENSLNYHSGYELD